MGEHILLVEDNHGLRHALKLYLELDDHEVRTAGSLDELERVLVALDRPPSIVISDLHLGRHRHGSDAIERIRQRFQRQVPAILLTEDVPTAIRSTNGTGIELLGKPIDPQRLAALVDGLLTRA
jgi:DNA-binding NtrC family response regulator